jgi:hypothetical protein
MIHKDKTKYSRKREIEAWFDENGHEYDTKEEGKLRTNLYLEYDKLIQEEKHGLE